MDDANQSQKAENFRALHHGDAPLVLPNAWDAGTAVLVANAGFPAIATTSAGVAFAMGRADGQQISRDDMLRAIEGISSRVSLPVTADIEAGYGDTPEQVGETIRLSIEAGAVGINLEDGLDHAAGTLYELPLAVERIAAARDAGQATGVPLVINGRTDVYFSPSLSDEEKFDEAVSRANAYIEAGADCAFVIRVADADAIRDLAAALNGPLNVIGGSGGLDINDLAALGVKRISLAGGLPGVAFGALRRALEEVRDQGSLSFLRDAIPHPEMNGLFTGV